MDAQEIARNKDAALRCMNAIRFRKMGRPIAPVWPICPHCKKMCSGAADLYSVSQTGFCSRCRDDEQ